MKSPRDCLLLLTLLFTTVVHAQVLTTEVWLGALDMREGRFRVSDLKNISNHPRYDNQPSFAPDGTSLLFTTEAESLSETGLGVHAVRYFLQDGRSVPLKRARGFSPTTTTDGRSFMTLREGTVWLHDYDGTPRRTLLPQVKTAGYFTRMDENRWVLFMNEKERHIALWDERRGSLSRLVPNAITAPYRIPGQQAVTFVVQEGDTKKLMQLDLTENGASDRELATIPFATGGAHVWTSSGTLLMASANAIHEWSPTAPEAWPVVHRFTEADLQGITRIALSPAEDRIALVSTPNDLTVLRESRDAANEAFAAAIAKQRGSSWVRTPATFEISGTSATERGTSVRRWREAGMPIELRRDYAVEWQRTMSSSGTPAWSIVSERYVN
ncbi:MAG TPA: hypothetical protein VF846_16550 [Thermoanaerobaculia bacterium]|jgi:hypothetical protein